MSNVRNNSTKIVILIFSMLHIQHYGVIPLVLNFLTFNERGSLRPRMFGPWMPFPRQFGNSHEQDPSRIQADPCRT